MKLKKNPKAKKPRYYNTVQSDGLKPEYAISTLARYAFALPNDPSTKCWCSQKNRTRSELENQIIMGSSALIRVDCWSDEILLKIGTDFSKQQSLKYRAISRTKTWAITGSIKLKKTLRCAPHLQGFLDIYQQYQRWDSTRPPEDLSSPNAYSCAKPSCKRNRSETEQCSIK